MKKTLLLILIFLGALSLRAQNDHHFVTIDLEMESLRPDRPTFMAYNLGADSTYNTPKKQMEYLSTQTNQLDGHVFGGFYQWGRKPVEYAINPTTYLRYNGNGAGNHAVVWTSSMTYTNGQLDGQDNYHIATSVFNYNWNSDHDDSLWGNGEAIGYDAFSSGVLHTNGKYYQKPVKTDNDPCPPGYRIPTQNDWELMCNYDCNPAVVASNFSTSTITKPANNSGLTWVNVACGGGKCTVSNDWDITGSPPWGGYAIYETSVWEAAPVAAGGSLISASAPQPLLFLPTAGYRHYDGCGVLGMGNGYYWSSSISGTTGITAYNFGISRTLIYSGAGNYRALGFSVRCVSE